MKHREIPAPLSLPQRVGTTAELCILALLAAAFLKLSLESLICTCVFDELNYAAEYLYFQDDLILLNYGVIALLLTLGALARRRLLPLLSRICLPALAAGMLLSVGAAAILWVNAVQSVPFSDSAYAVDAAMGMARGDAGPLSVDYFRWFPFQLGYVAAAEGLLRLTGAEGAEGWRVLALFNALCLPAAYLALLLISRELFRNRHVLLLTVLLLGLYPQLILYCSFQYGGIPSLAFTLWSLYCLLGYLKRRRWRSLLCCGLLLFFAVLLKPNALIAAVAAVLTLGLDLLFTKKWRSLAGAALLLTCALLAQPAAQGFYQARTGLTFGPGTPQTAWLAMGMQKSPNIPDGWFNGYTYTALTEADYDPEIARQNTRRDIAAQLAAWKKEPDTAGTFFLMKLLYQWNEPSFESLWVSRVRSHAVPLPPFVEDIYAGKGGAVLAVWFDQYVQIVYVFFLAGVFYLAGRREPACYCLPLLVLGALVYHLLFEAKSQYAAVYLPVMVPIAAYGMMRMAGGGKNAP